MDEVQARSLPLGYQLDLDRRRARRHRVVLLSAFRPAEGEHETTWRIDLHVLPFGDVPGEHLTVIFPAGPCLDRGARAHPAHGLVAVDEETPDGLRGSGDRDRPIYRGGFSRGVHACSSPPSRL